MARPDEEVNRLTENAYKAISDQFNPSLRNLITTGKNYEKSLSSVTNSAKSYFEALVKMGELAGSSHASKGMSDTITQMALTHKHILHLLEETLKSFRTDILSDMEQKLESDIKFLPSALRKYQGEHKAKCDVLDRNTTELKKLRRKSQGSKNPSKYNEKEAQVADLVAAKQQEVNSLVADGYRSVLLEERRRYCYFIERQCLMAQALSTYHSKASDLISQKLPMWLEVGSDVMLIPDAALAPVSALDASALRAGGLGGGGGGGGNDYISNPVPTQNTLHIPPELAALKGIGRSQHEMKLEPLKLDGPGGPAPFGGDGGFYGTEQKPRSPLSKPPPDFYANTLPSRKNITERPSVLTTDPSSGPFPRTTSMSTGLNRVTAAPGQRPRVVAAFAHDSRGDASLLSFQAGDGIALLVPAARDGWHYGVNERTAQKGWFPYSYTRAMESSTDDDKQSSRLVRSVSMGNLLEKEGGGAGIVLPPPDYDSVYSHPDGRAALPPPPMHISQPPTPDYGQNNNTIRSSNGMALILSSGNPFASVKLKPTVTNDRSGPMVK
ncbi:brain-specific angiogenesis inhibitor 1-associated protein 2 isoform X2 [Lethenteron reissneri]|uniref:brain-specific angiogenesis inhibitor 1-associated protein 2 isoform X2 n=1 Tax=Lethenteron reissneri TaxID=7753 RepID=UPI002AB60463|nr:brain-specific angiogenesis inhibitor 1-associated protein 2 isoform X2 [Lethenteron reissneri]